MTRVPAIGDKVIYNATNEEALEQSGSIREAEARLARLESAIDKHTATIAAVNDDGTVNLVVITSLATAYRKLGVYLHLTEPLPEQIRGYASYPATSE